MSQSAAATQSQPSAITLRLLRRLADAARSVVAAVERLRDRAIELWHEELEYSEVASYRKCYSCWEEYDGVTGAHCCRLQVIAECSSPKWPSCNGQTVYVTSRGSCRNCGHTETLTGRRFLHKGLYRCAK